MRIPHRLFGVVGTVLICGIVAWHTWRRWWAVIEMPLVWLLLSWAMGYQLWLIGTAMFDGTFFPTN